MLEPDDPSVVLVVTDGSGKPVWGATASLEYPRIRIQGRTDESGRGRFFFTDSVGFPWKGRVFVRAPGYAIAGTPEFSPSAENPPEVPVVLAQAHRVSGKVLFPDGSPAVGATVYVSNGAVPVEKTRTDDLFHGRRSPELPALVAYGWAPTDESGRFEEGGIPEGPYNLRATRSTDRVPNLGLLEAIATGVPTDAAEVVLTLPEKPEIRPSVALEGTVTDARTGARVRDFEAGLFGGFEGKERLRADRTAPGTFRFGAVPPGTWTLQVRGEGYVRWEREGIEVVPGDSPATIVARLERGATVRGIVRGLPESDLAEITIHFAEEGGEEGPRVRLAKDGSYAMAGFGPGAYRPEFWTTWPARDVLPALEEPVRLVVPEGASEVPFDVRVVSGGQLHFRVRRSGGAPSPGVPEADTAGEREARWALRVEIRDRRGRVVWSRQGRRPVEEYSVRLAPGGYEVRAEAPGAPPVIRPVSIERGEKGDHVSLEIEVP